MLTRVIAIVIAIVLVLVFAHAARSANVTPEGYCNGIRLCGKVKIVKNFADLKVQIVESFPDLRVTKVRGLPSKIGEWQFVEHGEDFTVEFAKSFPDLKIQYVDAFPGVR